MVAIKQKLVLSLKNKCFFKFYRLYYMRIANKCNKLHCNVFLFSFCFVCSIQEDIKDGKAYVFWNLDSEFQNTAVVCLGKPCKSFDPAELICDDKESVRAAASGKKRKR